MNYIRRRFAVLALLGLTACASQTTENHYYSLVLAADDSTSVVETEVTTTRVIVGPIQLARYLDQSGLALQVGVSQIRIANHHFWAEPLDEAIGKVLVKDLSQRLNGVVVDRDAGRWTDESDCRLRVEFDKFHATDDSRVNVTGRYWIHDSEHVQVSKRDFDIVQTLSANGYPQAVRQLRTSLETLAVEIAQRLLATEACYHEAP